MTRTDLWSQLAHLLQEECRAYGILRDLLKEEWTVLRTLNYQRLVDIASQKEAVLRSITKLEKTRVACGKVLSHDRQTEQSLTGLFESTLPAALPTKQVLKELLSIGAQVKALSDRNAGLLSRGLHVVREALTVVQEGLGGQPVYGESGQLSTPTVSTSLNVEG